MKRPAWTVRAVVALAAVILFAYGTGSAVYVAAFGVRRDPGTVVVAAPPELKGDALRLAHGFEAAYPDYRATLVESTGPGSGFRLLATGSADFALVTAPVEADLEPYLLPAETVLFRHADLLAVPFPSAQVALTLEEAETARAAAADRAAAAARAAAPNAGPANGLDAATPASAAVEDIQLLSPAERSPDKQLLEVAGVYPTLKTVLDGTYPLAVDVRAARRRPAGFWGFLGRLPFVRAWSEPNAAAADAFAAWLASDGARACFYGTSAEITLAAVGDVMLGRKTGRMIDQYGLDYPFSLVGERLAAADLTFCNLEAPLGTTGTMIPGKEIWLRGRPEYVQCLKQAGVDVVNLANNHILDYDSPCLLETMDILDRNGIAYAGAGPNAAAARRPAVLNVGGVRVAFLGFTEFADPGLFWDLHYRRTFLASDTEPGCNPLDLELVAEDIARAETLADVVVVVYHWGTEDVPYPKAWNPKNDLEAIARRTIELGADLVLGTHPHAQQGYEVYKGGLIAYSLGNFVNDQAKPTQKEAVILELELGPVGVLSARLVPCWIEDTTRPRYMQGEEAQRLLTKIREISVGFRDHR